MNSKKRMMFILEEDYYFITIKLLSILSKRTISSTLTNICRSHG